ncbi:WD repeat-containing protein [Aspergillus saccharolyticus JOP 1030-1]|uniref:WD40 repeat-like protein n=1 Tax=Aspergillus saccharolyticus JOP 1030-1 TaxID=1450539 RepID=A0A318ZTK2_9EURO|nr:WD40 repeat-like protein [Aspergillus saccharolyticus JOP 1030-1]PYH50004.1 WD40 repeat-like protein [Aspergillus saccharolyticus JOP 1030-1]
MKESLYDRIWRRESGELSRLASIQGLYGASEWVKELDIVNELGGHSGCVNALSWSRSGRLLASGSDDQHLNIYAYQPDSSAAPFTLNTTIDTGHTANIFSVKFMPHSNDRTLVSCAGDSQVRVFDIEYSSSNGHLDGNSNALSSARGRRFHNFFNTSHYLSPRTTNAKVYRSHADRVKRIVTESSPHLFLTCSEDGEVRQWDLRQPSSAYPKPLGGQGYMAFRSGQAHDDSNVPPPLISYKKYRLDLNTISCSPSQPHYIALGGAHLHCFLHDRRMLGRDLIAERGGSNASFGSSSQGGDILDDATRCVRRFAPNGQDRMKTRDDGHITACKISDANPNEMVVSWSGDHIYSFDLIRSPDAREVISRQTSVRETPAPRKRRGSKDRKRKRHPGTSMSSESSGIQPSSRRRPRDCQDEGELAFRVRYGNGESEDIPLPSLTQRRADVPGDLLEQSRMTVLSDAQRLSMRIAKELVKLRKALFSLDMPAREELESANAADLAPFGESFSQALTHAAICLPQMSEVIRTWGYPLNPSPDMVRFQQTLRRNRTIARALGGEIQDTPGDVDREMEQFQQITPLKVEHALDRKEQFGYDFIKAIILYIEGGREAMLSGFKRGPVRRDPVNRFPIPETADDRAIESVLIPYLQRLAGEAPVVNVDASRFEHDEARILFSTQREAVAASSADSGSSDGAIHNGAAHNGSSTGPHLHSHDLFQLTQFWIGTGVNYAFVNRAFGGFRTTITPGSESDIDPERSQNDLETNIEEEPIRDVRLKVLRGEATESETSLIGVPGTENESGEDEEDGFGDERDDDDDENGDDEDDDEGNNDEYELDLESLASDSDDSEAEDQYVHLDVSCSPHTRVYRGHCNVKTVKDVNFYGLDDEYVVSGSDSVNILEGDSEVVNVVQGTDSLFAGHPYEPTIAASGIDNTIKIFSPDRRAQDDARPNTLGPHVRGIGGLSSRKRLHDSGMSEASITRHMLARLATTLRDQHYNVEAGGSGEHATLVLDENSCHLKMMQALQERAEVTRRLYEDPHNPHLYYERGLAHEKLGFPDLASADAYRALSLLDSVIDPDGCEFHARRRLQGSVEGTEPEVHDEASDDSSDDEDQFSPLTQSEYDTLIHPVYALLVRTLVSCGCFRDAYEFCTQALNLSSDGNTTSSDREAYSTLKAQLSILQREFARRRNLSSPTTAIVIDDPSALPAQGYARRILYPWNTHEPDRKAPDTLDLLNEKLRTVAPKCEVRAVALPALHSTTATKPITTNTSSAEQQQQEKEEDEQGEGEGQRVYHGAVCGLMENLESIGKDIPDPKDKADYLYLLLLGRALAMAATQEVHPLELDEIKYIWGDFVDYQPPTPAPSDHNADADAGKMGGGGGTLPFSFQLNILQPMRLLEEMEIDPYANLRHYDTWVLNTLYAKFRGTASGRLSSWDGGPELCAVHPLWCLANHSCDPNVRWEWGGEITFVARAEDERAVWSNPSGDSLDRTPESRRVAAGIKKDEEILNHYCDIGLGVKDRREWACGALGGFCLCERCRFEAGEM